MRNFKEMKTKPDRMAWLIVWPLVAPIFGMGKLFSAGTKGIRFEVAMTIIFGTWGLGWLVFDWPDGLPVAGASLLVITVTWYLRYWGGNDG